MNAAENLRFVADRIDDGKEFEYRISENSCWVKAKVDTYALWIFYKGSFEDSEFVLSDILKYGELRSIPKLPRLTQEEKYFLKWFPQDWWIARSEKGRIYIYDHKPHKNVNEGDWYAEGSWEDIPRIISLTFTEIKWSDEDCYTIGELRKNETD